MSLKCPYCNVVFSEKGLDCDYSNPKFYNTAHHLNGIDLNNENRMGNVAIISHYCPECKRPIMWMYDLVVDSESRGLIGFKAENYRLLFPKYPPVIIHKNVPKEYADDYSEAFQVLPISPKASAALSRRCLQRIIQNVENIKKRNLEEEINCLIELNKLPQYIVQDIDSIRIVGNFAAHPKKSENTSEIVDVEPGEAEWLLKTLENVLKFYFVDLKDNEERRNMFKEKYGK